MLDTNKSGIIYTTEIQKKFNSQRHPAVTEGWKTQQQIKEEFKTLINLYTGTYGTIDKLSKEEFTDLYSCISSSIESDEYFITMLKNTWNLDTTAYNPSINFAKTEGNRGESIQSPFATSTPETSLVKTVHEVSVEAPYHTAEKEKISGNICNDHMRNKTDALILKRFREILFPRGVKGILGLERLFKIYGKDGFITLDNLMRSISDFHIAADNKDLGTLFKTMDEDDDGKVAYVEIVKSIIGDMSEARKKEVKKAFNVIDVDNDGWITKDDINKALDGVKHPEVKQGKKTREDLMREINDSMELSKMLRVSV